MNRTTLSSRFSHVALVVVLAVLASTATLGGSVLAVVS